MSDQTLPALVVKVEGAVLETNIDAFRDAALVFVEKINTTLATDDDFAEAEGVVKWCGDAEKKIKAVKESAMEQAADINAVFTALDEISSSLRDKRLSLNKQVKAQKETRKREVIDEAMAELTTHVDGLNAKLDGFSLDDPSSIERDLEKAAKGKRTIATLEKAIAKVVKDAKSEYAATHKLIVANAKALAAHEDHAFLFADAAAHIESPVDEFTALVKARIAEHEEAEKERLEALKKEVREEVKEEVKEEVRAEVREEVEEEVREELEEEESDERAAGRDNPHSHHGIDYIEIGALDVAAAKRFYSAALGWTFTDYGEDYAGIQGDGREPGGLCKTEEVVRGGALIVLYSEDFNASFSSVGAAGGKIVKPPFEFPGGRQFHFTDPSGNEIALWSDM